MTPNGDFFGRYIFYIRPHPGVRVERVDPGEGGLDKNCQKGAAWTRDKNEDHEWAGNSAPRL